MNEDSVKLSSRIGFILLMTGIFFLNFLSRIILAPLLPTLENDLGIGHGEAGSLFFIISLGYFPALIGSGFLSSRFTHRRIIIFSSMALGVALFAVSFSNTIWGIRIGLLMLGMTAGIYLPSGISTITSLVRGRDWGKAIAIHELAPNLSFLVAPLISEALMIWFSWRHILAIIGITSVFVALIFARFGKGGDFNAEPPSLGTLKILLSKPSFWIMAILFSLGIGGSLGIYTMLPLYLVTEHGMTQSYANYLVALSRISGLGIAFLSGLATDRLGPKITIGSVLVGTGLTTLLLGLTSGSWIVFIVFLQPMIAVCFFPPGFTALSRIGPANIRNISVSFTVPIGFFMGGGVMPAVIGFLGDRGFFSLGFLLVGVMIISGFILLNYLKFSDD